MKTLVASQKKQLQEAQDQQGKGENKLSSALQLVRQLQEEKGNLEAKLGQRGAAMQAQVCLIQGEKA